MCRRKNRLFGETYRLHFQGQDIQRTMNTLAVACSCSTLRIINHYMRKEAIERDILNGGMKERFFDSVSVVFFRSSGYDRPLLLDGCYRTLPIWEVTSMLQSLARRYVPSKRRFLQNPQGDTSQKTVFFIVTAVKNSNLTTKLSV
jgi:hypothetical protein